MFMLNKGEIQAKMRDARAFLLPAREMYCIFQVERSRTVYTLCITGTQQVIFRYTQ